MADNFLGGKRILPTGETAVAAYVYDANSLSWQAQTAATAGSGGSVNVTNPTLAVTQSGAWSVGSTNTTASAPISVRLSDGGAFYTASGGGGGGNLATGAKGSTSAGSPTSENTDANTQALHTKLVNTSLAVTGSFWQATQPVSLSSVPLPSGAATETTLAALNTKTPSLGQATMTNSVPVVLSSNQSSIPVTGTFWQATQPVSASSLPLPSGAATETTLAALSAKIGALGQTTMAGSTPVVIASNQSAISVSGTFWQATQPVSLSTLPALATGSNTIGNVNVNGTVPVSGTFWQATQPVSGTVSVSGSVTTVGAAAAGASVSGNPILNGGRAATANPTAVTDGQASNVMTDKVGRQVVVQGHVREQVDRKATTITSSTSVTTVVAAGGSGVFTDITSLIIMNSSATATLVTLSDGTVSYVYYLGAGSGFTMPFNPPLPATTANTAWTLTCGTSVASVYCNVVYVDNT